MQKCLRFQSKSSCWKLHFCIIIWSMPSAKSLHERDPDEPNWNSIPHLELLCPNSTYHTIKCNSSQKCSGKSFYVQHKMHSEHFTGLCLLNITTIFWGVPTIQSYGTREVVEWCHQDRNSIVETYLIRRRNREGSTLGPDLMCLMIPVFT